MKNQFLVDQLQKLEQHDFEYLYEYACVAGCFNDLPEDDNTIEIELLAQAIVDDEDVAEEAAHYIDIGL